METMWLGTTIDEEEQRVQKEETFHQSNIFVQDSSALSKTKTNPFEETDEGNRHITLMKWLPPDDTFDFQAEVQSLKEKLVEKDETYTKELEQYKDTHKKHLQLIEKMQSRITQYSDQCNELEDKLENISKSNTELSQPLPSAVCQLVAKVKELKKQNNEMEKSHATEIQDIILDNNRQAHRALQLSASNTALTNQLEDAQKTVDELKSQLDKGNKALLRERDKMEQKKDYCSTVATVCNNQAAILRQDLEKLKQDTSQNVNLLCDELNMAGEILKVQIDQERGSYQSLQHKVSSDMHQKDTELVKVSAEMMSLQKEYIIQTDIYKELVQELEIEVASLKGKMKQQTEKDILQSNELLAVLMEEKEQCQEDVQLFKQAISSIASTVQPQEEFAGNASQATEWAISAVENGLRSQTCLIEKLQSKLALSQMSCEELTSQLLLKQSKEKQEYSATDIMKRELYSCQSQLKEVSQNKRQLEGQIEKIVSQKMEVDTKLSHFQSSLTRLEEERSSTVLAHSSLEKTVKDLEVDIKEIQTNKENLETEMTKKKHVVSRLQQQLVQGQSEIHSLQAKLTTLKSEQLEMEKEMFETKSKVDSLESEKELLEKELHEILQSEQSLLKRMVEFQQVNSILESEKRALQHSLDNVSANQIKLDKKNSKLTSNKMAQDDEIEALRTTNNILTDQVDELDKNLQEMETICTRLRREKSGLKQQTILLNEAFVKTRQTISEVQLQRGQLNTSVAKIAQEKAMLIHEKVQLASNIAHLEGSLKSSLQTIAIFANDKESLSDKVREFGGQSSVARERITELENIVDSLHKGQEKQGQDCREEFEAMKESLNAELEKCKQDMQRLRDDTQIKTTTYERSLANLKKSHHVEMISLKNDHSHEVMLLVSNHDVSVTKFQTKIKSIKKEHGNEMACISQEKESAVSRLEKEKAVIADKLKQQQRTGKYKCEELEQAKLEAEIRSSELKDQLEESEKNAEVLSSELNYIEGQIQKLQGLLEQVRIDAEAEISQLQTDMVSSAAKVVELEEKNTDNILAIRHYENNVASLKKQLEEAQDILEKSTEEGENLKTEKQSLESKLKQVQTNYSKACETMTCFEKLLEDSKDEKVQTSNECRRLRKVLQFSEQALSKLTEEHRQLEALFTASQKELNTSRIQIESLKEETEELHQSTKEYQLRLSDLQCRLRVVSIGFESKEEDLKSALNATHSLLEENEGLKSSLECHQLEVKEFFSENMSLTEKLEELKSQRIDLMNTIQTLETSFEKERINGDNLHQEMAATKIAKTRMEEELNKILNSYQDLRSTHSKFLAILEGTLEPQLAREFDEKKLDRFHGDALWNDSFESGIASPDQAIMIASPPPPPQLSLSIDHPEELSHFISKLQNNVISQRKSNQSLTGELEHIRGRLDNILSQKDHLGKQVQELKSLLKQQEQSLDSTLITKRELQATVNSQLEEIKELNLKLRELHASHTRTKEELELCQVKNEATTKQLKKFTDTQMVQEIEKREIQSELKKTKLNEMLYENELANLKKEKEKWQSLEVRRETKMTELLEENQTIRLSHNKMQTEMKNLEQILKDTLKHRDKLWSTLKSKQDKEMEFETEISRLISHAVDCEGMLKNQIQQTLSIKTRADDHIKLLDEELQGLKKQFNQSEMTKKELESTVVSLRATIEELSAYEVLNEERKIEQTELRKALEKNVVGLKVTLDTEVARSSSNKEMCQKLLKERDSKEIQLQEAREETARLQEQVERGIRSSEQVDTLLQKQTELTNSLAASLKLNSELTHKLQAKDVLYDKEVQSLQNRDQEMLKIGQKLYTTQFEGRESEYRKLVKQLEKKVILLDGELSHIKYCRDELVSETEKQKRAIATFHRVLSHDDLSRSGVV